MRPVFVICHKYRHLNSYTTYTKARFYKNNSRLFITFAHQTKKIHFSVLSILYEDNHIIIVNKTVHDLVQGDKTGDITLADKVKTYIKQKYDKPGEVFLGVTHRLDRPTSGLVVFARTSKALERMNRMFAEHQIKKTYWAIVEKEPQPDEAQLTHYLKRIEKNNKTIISSDDDKNAKKAILDYKVIARGDRYTLLSVNLQTGRHHQIRAQLSAIGSIIKGDLKYGAHRSNKDGGICLHSRRIQFEHPVSHLPIDVTAPVPNDKLWQALESQIDNQ